MNILVVDDEKNIAYAIAQIFEEQKWQVTMANDGQEGLDLALSGYYDTDLFFGQYVDENIYNNSPLKYLNGMSRNHPYVDLYNQRHIILCCGQGAWEDEMVKSTGLMKETFDRLGVNAWCDFWGSDVNHDWPWWRKQLPYFLGHIL